MKKKVKKLQLSWETLRDLENLDAQKVLGGNQGPPSVQSQDCACGLPTLTSG
jgi:hypothetical protein